MKTWQDFRSKYPQSALSGYIFDQTDQFTFNDVHDDGVDLSVIGKPADVVVKTGACRELCRMWVFARNFPIAVAGMGRPDNPAELCLLEAKFSTIMVSQALSNVGALGRDSVGIAGLAAQYRKCGNVDTLSDKLLAGAGSLALANVQIGSGAGDGNHAVAFDTRNSNFVMFDPNRGMFVARTKLKVTTLLADYFRVFKYKPIHVYRYSQC